MKPSWLPLGFVPLTLPQHEQRSKYSDSAQYLESPLGFEYLCCYPNLYGSFLDFKVQIRPPAKAASPGYVASLTPQHTSGSSGGEAGTEDSALLKLGHTLYEKIPSAHHTLILEEKLAVWKRWPCNGS
ncbi:hypothetical protein NDU88_002090 [Pleurodeles waltl]|uniref:Uncharacterized protein n=1 Tax=Pleurodeles waltl TaxID=8319 RepID=A0AAV7Q7Y1_PLEWA|nr:hypothetical protein NDU88_002090 [Pleurodeles waltl]